jgi:hypothetical protein
MANGIQPFEGPFVLDYQNLSGVLIDAADGATLGRRREKNDWEKANLELTSRLPIHAAALRVAPDLGDQITTLNDRIAQVRALKVQAEKLVEVLGETEVVLEDEREGLVGLVVDSARKAKRNDPGLMVAFQEAIRYHGQLGKRAAKTRWKNLEAAEAEGNGEEQPAPQAS